MKTDSVAIFGGTFDPFHFGHLNSVLSVAEQFHFTQVRVVPAAISPLRIQTQGSEAEHRMAMIRLGLKDHEDLIQMDSREIDRGGVSYTIDTLKSFVEELPEIQISLVIGMDQFEKFDQWKDFDEILEMANLIVTSRPGLDLPKSLKSWPIALHPFVEDFDSSQALLTSGKSIHFFQLEDVEVSASEIRRKVRLGQSLQKEVPSEIEEYIRRHGLYKSVQTKIGDFAAFAEFCMSLLNSKGGINTQLYDIQETSSLSDFAVITSGTSTRHASALAEHLMQEVKKRYGVWPENMEGHSEGRWVVIDYGALIAHIFYDYVRQEYRLEDLWSKKP